jgi:hypothetical protein
MSKNLNQSNKLLIESYMLWIPNENKHSEKMKYKRMSADFGQSNEVASDRRGHENKC